MLCIWVLVSGGFVAVAGLLVIATVALAFGVRGYSVGDGVLEIRHLG